MKQKVRRILAMLLAAAIVSGCNGVAYAAEAGMGAAAEMPDPGAENGTVTKDGTGLDAALGEEDGAADDRPDAEYRKDQESDKGDSGRDEDAFAGDSEGKNSEETEAGGEKTEAEKAEDTENIQGMQGDSDDGKSVKESSDITGADEEALEDAASEENETQMQTVRRSSVQRAGTAASDFEYTVSNNKVTIKKYKGSASTVVVPDMIGDYPVTEIGSSAFSGCASLVDVRLPDDIETIGGSAFSSCTRLSKVKWPEKLKKIGGDAFEYTDLRELRLPGNLESVGSWAFEACKNLESVEFSYNSKVGFKLEIGYASFKGCTSLWKVSLTENVKELPSEVFSGCSSLEILEIPESVTKLGYYMVQGTAIQSIQIPQNVSQAAGYDNNRYGPFSGAEYLKTVTFEEGMERIPNLILTKATKVTKIIIPSTVREIGGSAFSGCTSLVDIVLPDNIEIIEGSVFSNCTKLSEVKWPAGLKKIGGDAFEYTDLRELQLPGNLESVGSWAFEACKNLESVKFTYNNKVGFKLEISYAAFKGCTSLWKVSLTENVKELPSEMFSGCSSLEILEIPESVTKLGYYMVQGTAIQSIQIPQNVSQAAGYDNNRYGPFSGAEYLKTVTFEEGMERIPNLILTKATKVTKIIIPSTVREIGGSAFSGCTSLVDIVLPDNIEIIEGSVFSNCTKLSEVKWPAGLKKIGGDAFEYTDLRELRLPGNLESVGSWAFEACKNLENVEFSYNSKVGFKLEIGYAAFKGCTSLWKVSLSENVKELPSELFSGCSSLEILEIPESVTKLGYYMIQGTAIQSIVMPKQTAQVVTYDSNRYGPFSGAEYLSTIILAEGSDTILEGCFLDMPNLLKIVIPKSVINVSENSNAFKSSKNVKIYGIKGSSAEVYAGQKNIEFVAVESTSSVEHTIVGELGQVDRSKKTVTVGGIAYSVSDDLLRQATEMKILHLVSMVVCNVKSSEIVRMDSVQDAVTVSNTITLRKKPLGVVTSGSQETSTKTLEYDEGNDGNGTYLEDSITIKLTLEGKMKSGYICSEQQIETIKEAIKKVKLRKQKIKVEGSGLKLDLSQYQTEIDKGQISIPDSRDGFVLENPSVELGKSGTKYFTFAVNHDYTPKKERETIRISSEIMLDGEESYYPNNRSSCTVTIINHAYDRQQIRRAKKETEARIPITDAENMLDQASIVSLDTNFLGIYLDGKQQKSLEAFLNVWISMILNSDRFSYSEYTKKEKDLRNEVLKKLGINEKTFNKGKTLEATSAIDFQRSKYGNITIFVKVTSNNFYLGVKDPYAAVGTIELRVIGANPPNKPTSNSNGLFAYKKMTSFVDQVKDAAEAELKIAYKSAWADDADKIKEYLPPIIVNDTINDILKEKYGTFSNIIFQVSFDEAEKAANAKKRVGVSVGSGIGNTVGCVNVNVFDRYGELCGAIRNGVVDPELEGVSMTVEDGMQYVYLMEDSYTVQLVGTQSGTTSYQIEEYSGSELVRTVKYDDITIRKGQIIEGNVPDALFNATNRYDLTYSSGRVLNATEDTWDGGSSERVFVEGISLDQSKAALKPGEQLSLNASILPENADWQLVDWSSSNLEAAIVNGEGTVKAVSEGTAVITVTTVEGGYEASCTVTVSKDGDTPSGDDKPSGGDTPSGDDKPSGGDTPTGGSKPSGDNKPSGGQAVSGGNTQTVKPKLNMKTIPLKVKQSTKLLKVLNMPSGVKVKSYSVTNKKIASVSKKGVIKAKKKGKTTLSVVLSNGTVLKAAVKVQKGTVRTTKLTVPSKKIVLKKGKKIKLSAECTPLTTQEKLTYKTSDKSVVTVDKKGKLTAKKAGKAKITVKSGKKKIICTVTVKK